MWTGQSAAEGMRNRSVAGWVNTFSYVAGKMGAAAAFDSYLALQYNLSCFLDGLCRLRKDPALFRNQPLTYGDGGKIFQKIEETAIDSLQG